MESITRLKMEGTVILKRKSQWVRRTAKIENCIFSYKRNATDKKNKVEIDLQKAKIMLGVRIEAVSQFPYIFIQANPLKPEVIRICLEEEDTFNEWL